MKKKILQSCACAALLALSACSEHDGFIGELSSALSVRVGVSVGQENRSVVYGESLPNGAEIGLFLEGDNDPNGRYDGLTYANCLYTATGTDSEQQCGTASSVLLSPSIGTVYGYYPYYSEVTDMTKVPVDITASDIDFMYALPATSIPMSNNKAYLVMNHALCMVRLMLRKGNYTREGVVSNVKLTCSTRLAKTGVLNARTGKLDQVGPAVTNSFQHLGRITVANDYHVFPDFIGVPRKVSAPVKVEMTVDGRPYSCTSDITSEQGRIYMLNLQIDESKRSFTPSVEA